MYMYKPILMNRCRHKSNLRFRMELHLSNFYQKLFYDLLLITKVNCRIIFAVIVFFFRDKLEALYFY